MNTNLDSHRLLDDLLEESAPAEFRAALLDQLLHQAQRQNRRRRRTGPLAALALLTITLLAIWQIFLQPTSRPSGRQSPVTMVHSQPLKSGLLVESTLSSVKMVSSRRVNVSPVESPSAPGTVQEIDDETLLTLLTGHPAALIKRGPDQAELIFVDTPGQSERPLN